MRILMFFMACGLPMGDGPGIILSLRSKADFALTADPESAAWKGVEATIAKNGPMGGAVANHRTQIRSRWTEQNLYVLFVCPYEELFLKPNPTQKAETNKLWEWDVAE